MKVKIKKLGKKNHERRTNTQRKKNAVDVAV